MSVSSQSFTKERKIVRSYALTNETEISLTNKYGDITIENWEKDSVKIEISYKVTTTKESKLEPIFDAINFKFNANKYYVVAKSVFEGRGSFWFDVSEIANNLFSSGTHTSINYVVYIPKNSHLKLNLKYGRVFITNHTGIFDLSLSNGDFKANNITGKTKLNIEYGDAIVKNMESAIVKVRYGTFNLRFINNLELIGQSSEFDFDTVNNLIIDSKRDKLSVNNVGSLVGSSYFSKLFIGKVLGKFDLEAKYGAVNIKTISSTVSKVNLTAFNANAELYFVEKNNYKIELISDNKAEVAYSANLGEFIITELPDKFKKAICLYGVGNNPIMVNIKINSGFLKLKIDE